MEAYLLCGSIVVGIEWLYLFYNWFKAQKEFQKASGVNSFSPIKAFQFHLNSSKSETELLAYNKLKQQSKRHFLIWVVTLLLFMTGAVIVGITGAMLKKI